MLIATHIYLFPLLPFIYRERKRKKKDRERNKIRQTHRQIKEQIDTQTDIQVNRERSKVNANPNSFFFLLSPS